MRWAFLRGLSAHPACSRTVVNGSRKPINRRSRALRCKLRCSSRAESIDRRRLNRIGNRMAAAASASATARTVARSLAEASRLGKRVRALELRGSPDLRCVNLMCEKVGEACICRLARVLALTPEVERLDLGKNGLEALPDEVFRLRHLRVLDLSGNNLRALPPAITELQALEVVTVDGSLLRQLEPTVAEFVKARAIKSGLSSKGEQ